MLMWMWRNRDLIHCWWEMKQRTCCGKPSGFLKKVTQNYSIIQLFNFKIHIQEKWNLHTYRKLYMHIYSIIFITVEKRNKGHATTWMNPENMLSEISQTSRIILWFPSLETVRTGKSIETESKEYVVILEWGNWKWLLNGYRVLKHL